MTEKSIRILQYILENQKCPRIWCVADDCPLDEYTTQGRYKCKEGETIYETAKKILYIELYNKDISVRENILYAIIKSRGKCKKLFCKLCPIDNSCSNCDTDKQRLNKAITCLEHYLQEVEP